MRSEMIKERVIVIGSGPAGLTAALYAARAQLEPLVIVGNQLGGQISITAEVENYPGFPEADLTGPELVDRMVKQAERFGARLEYDEVVEVHFGKGLPFYVKTHANEYEAEAVIVTAGASPRRLGVPGEESMIGRGVSFAPPAMAFSSVGRMW
jgi:thioredoxin reductase (NADPH)